MIIEIIQKQTTEHFLKKIHTLAVTFIAVICNLMMVYTGVANSSTL